MLTTKYKYTEEGEERVKSFIKDCERQRQNIIDLKLDEIGSVKLPTPEDILADFEYFVDAEGEYYNYWQISENRISNYPITLVLGEDVIIEE